jgi:hypothetical protein
MDHKNRVKGVDLFCSAQNTVRCSDSAAAKIRGGIFLAPERLLASYEPCSLELVSRLMLYINAVETEL